MLKSLWNTCEIFILYCDSPIFRREKYTGKLSYLSRRTLQDLVTPSTQDANWTCIVYLLCPNYFHPQMSSWFQIQVRATEYKACEELVLLEIVLLEISSTAVFTILLQINTKYVWTTFIWVFVACFINFELVWVHCTKICLFC